MGKLDQDAQDRARLTRLASSVRLRRGELLDALGRAPTAKVLAESAAYYGRRLAEAVAALQLAREEVANRKAGGARAADYGEVV